ncbi:four helix bundle protein [Thermoflexibacter ruber]|uniref:Four helix bundle protein n=1 Tax=Thermoflexibacter ruber TaxID=1003 RepID=A0A1I2HQM0_9BACT|nr:four helix bundle protein [Thermoflexibacter ruber]SFF31703.1 four helix bundle protein [Thermoflexibacter ruber]
MKNNVILDRSFAFALRILKLHKYMIDNGVNYNIANQVLKSGTSIGANAEEAVGGLTSKDFLFKMTIAYKEARETHYWLRLLRDGEILEEKLANSLINDCEEILKIITSIQKTVKEKLDRENKKDDEV